MAVALSLGGCASLLSWENDRATGVIVEEGDARWYVVNAGDTLYSIAFEAGQDYRELARWNGIRWPYRIHPDQRLRLSPPRLSTAGKPNHRRSVTRRDAPATNSPGRNTRTPSASTGHRAPEPRTPSNPTASPLAWQWPTEGPLLKNYSASDTGRKGIDIGGRLGQSVIATAPGRVVYSGSGLRGYGKLIIIKHNSVYLSAYGHNRRVLVKEGETLRAGQQIAELGDTDADRPMLHFEIRRNGEPVDPQRLLPKRR